MAVKTKINAQAPIHILSLMEDDLDSLAALRKEAYDKKKGEIVFKGFRKGHVPQEIAEDKIGFDNLYEDVIRKVLADGLAASQEKIVGLGQVWVDVFEDKKPIILRAEVWIEPKVNLTGESSYKGLPVKMDPITVDETEVDAVIQRQREAAAVVEPVERESQVGDVVVITFLGKLEDGSEFNGNQAKEFQLVLGSGALLPEFEAALVGVKAGETRLVNITFPTTWGNKDLAGKKAVFTTEVVAVKKRDLPEVNDEFAKSLGYADVAEARTRINDALLLNKKQQAKSLVEHQLLSKLALDVNIDPIPRCMINNQIRTSLSNLFHQLKMTEEEYLKKAKIAKEELESQYEQQAFVDVRVRLILRAIAEAEKIVVTEEEREQSYKDAQSLFPDVKLEDLKQRLNADILDGNIKIRKALDIVRESAMIEDKKPV
jgi:trigger factor